MYGVRTTSGEWICGFEPDNGDPKWTYRSGEATRYEASVALEVQKRLGEMNLIVGIFQLYNSQ